MLELHEILRQLKREKYDFLNSLRAQFRYHIESKFCMVGSSFNCIVSARFALIQSYSSILFGCSDTQFSRNTSDKLGKSDDLVQQSAANTATTIYNTIVNVGFNILNVAEKGEGSPDYGEQIGKSNLTERNLATTSLTEEGSSRGYDDNQSNISKPNSSAASDEDDIGELENLEPNSPDPDYTYFGEMSLTDLYSMPGFQKDVHEEVPDQGYCPLYVADSNL